MNIAEAYGDFDRNLRTLDNTLKKHAGPEMIAQGSAAFLRLLFSNVYDMIQHESIRRLTDERIVLLEQVLAKIAGSYAPLGVTIDEAKKRLENTRDALTDPQRRRILREKEIFTILCDQLEKYGHVR